MSKPALTNDPRGAALTSVVLGAVGALLFFLPILCIPLGGIGVLFALAGIVCAMRRDARSLRWSITGLVVSAAALGAGITIGKAPADHPRTPSIPSHVQRTRAQPYVPPPARPGQ
jgi:hypothetical protein